MRTSALVNLKEFPKKFDLLVALILLIIVPLFYIYQLFPQEEKLFVYRLTTKLAPIVILSIWFVTCGRWYCRYISVPLLMFLCQFCSAIVNDAVVAADHWLYLPIALTVLLLICELRRWRRWLRLGGEPEKTMYSEAFALLMNAFRKERPPRPRPMRRVDERRARGDYVIAAILLLSAPLSYAYLLFPEDSSFFTSGYFNSQGFVYHFFAKLTAVAQLTAWLLSCQERWWHAIAAPLTMYCFQLISLVSVDTELIDKEHMVSRLVPLAMLFVYGLYRARRLLVWADAFMLTLVFAGSWNFFMRLLSRWIGE